MSDEILTQNPHGPNLIPSDPSPLDFSTFERLAERVGVGPLAEDVRVAFAFVMPDGRRFDPCAVFNAMLERLVDA